VCTAVAKIDNQLFHVWLFFHLPAQKNSVSTEWISV
jgi:hypothetical protein